MKRGILLCAAGLLMCGCSSPGNQKAGGVATIAEAPPKWIEKAGDHRTGDTWVSVNPQDGKLTISHVTTKTGPGVRSTTTSSSSPDGWRAQEGWFAFIEEEGKKIWVYDGKESLLLSTWERSEKEDSSSIFGPGNFPGPIPEPVLARLKEPFRSKVQKNPGRRTGSAKKSN